MYRWLNIYFNNNNSLIFVLQNNYPFRKIDQILQKVVGAQRMSMIDGFSWYNQIAVHPDDR